MNAIVESNHDCAGEVARLEELAADVLRRARAAGASQAEVAASIDSGLSVNVRRGEVETVEHHRDRGFGITVYFGQRKGSAGTADLKPESIEATLQQACAIARYTEPDPASGLADPARMAREFPDLDLWHPWDIDVPEAVELGVAMEATGLAVAGVTNSEGATVQRGQGIGVYANSHGFSGASRGTHHSLSAVLIGAADGGMQRDYWYDSVRDANDFMAPAEIGRIAGERAVARLGARELSTRQCPVLFTPEVAGGLIGHLVGAVSGGALYRNASFLVGKQGSKLFPDWLDIVERPRLPRGHGSAVFDSEGVATADSALIERGVLARYILGSYSARKLGLQSTGNAGGIHNLVVGHGDDDFDALLRRMDRGLVVTELMGQGVNIVTGDYSRGASGFWVEDGAIAYPVEGVTIAGNLADMFASIVAVGNDVDRRSSILTGSILVEQMTLAGS